MPVLKNGSELCDTCNKPYVAKLNGYSCTCPLQIVIKHEGEEIETAAVLKWRQRARVADEALAESEKHQLNTLSMIMSYAGNRRPEEGCRLIIEFIKEVQS